MITVSGRRLSRAWLAVAAASSTDPDRPALCRAVRVEVHDLGLLLVATDGYWLARCWVPAIDVDDDVPVEPLLEEVPVVAVTVIDDEGRVRDLMRHVARLTRKPDADDVEVRLTPARAVVDELRPPLDESLAEVRCEFDLPGREKVFAHLFDAEGWLDWRKTVAGFTGSGGARVAEVSAWMLQSLGRVAQAVQAAAVRLDWLDPGRARWSAEPEHGEALWAWPHGVLVARRIPEDAFTGPDTPPPHNDDEDGDGPVDVTDQIAGQLTIEPPDG